MAGTTEGQGLIARVTTALRYAINGTTPTDWFGPGATLPPQAPEDVRGRQFDYPVSLNINYRPRSGEPLGFDRLKLIAKHPVVAMLIQRQKDKVSAVPWQIKLRHEEHNTGKVDASVKAIRDFLEYPDKEHDWCQWIGAVLDQLMVIDAVSIYGAQTRMGDPYALQLLDGATIKPVLDLGGRRPAAPDPAYQQILKGLPAIDYTADDLIYFPQTYRADRVYGYSRVEQGADLIEAAILRLKSQKGYFEFGNLGDGYFTAPDGWTPEQTIAFENRWNSLMQGVDPSQRRVAPFVPGGTEWHATKTEVLSDAFDEFLIRLMCFPFGVAPTPFMKQTGLGHGSAGSEHDAAEEGGIAPLMQYVERLMCLIITKWFGRPDLEFSFIEDREFDPKTKSEIEDRRLKNGSLSLNEVRDRNGEPPLPDGDKPLIYLGSEVILLEDAIKPRPDPVAPVPATEPAQPAGVVGTAPAGQVAPEKPVKKLAKASDKAALMRLKAIIAAYLTAKAKTYSADLAGSLAKADKPAPPEDFLTPVDDALDALDFTWSDLPELVQPILAGIAVAAATEQLSSLGLFDAETLARVTARAVGYADRRAAELVGMRWVDGELVTNPDAEWAISETTRDMLRSLITNSMAEGTSNDELKSEIYDATAFSESRAEMIARSETALADIRGSAIAWAESGVVDEAQFDAAPDCCEECQAEDGTIVPLADPEELDLPHPGCRCAWVAVIKDETQPAGEDDNEE
jgi:hypothetical protein